MDGPSLITELGYSLATEAGDRLIWRFDWPPPELGPLIVAEFAEPLATERGNYLTWHSHRTIAPSGPSIITEYGEPFLTDGIGSPLVWLGISQSVTRRYVRVVPANASTPQLIDFPAVGPAQLQTCAIDYGKFLPAQVALKGTPALTVSVRLGTDHRPSSILSAAPVIGTIPIDLGGTGRVNAAILFQIYGGFADVTYVIEFRCDRTDGDVADNWVRLACVAKS